MHTIVSIIIENIWSNDYDRSKTLTTRCEEGIEALAWNLKQQKKQHTTHYNPHSYFHFKIKNNMRIMHKSWRLGLGGGMKLV